MINRRRLREILIWLLWPILIGFVAPCSAEEISVEARMGNIFKLHVFADKSARRTLLLFEDQGGKYKPNGQGFVSRSIHLFRQAGFNVAVMTPPQNKIFYNGGMAPKFRGTKEHAVDIQIAVQILRKKTGRKVWLVGLGLGTKSLATFISSNPNDIDGLVFLSGLTDTKGSYKAITDYDYSSFKRSVLAISHKKDSCPESPPDKAGAIIDLMTNAAFKKLVAIEASLEITKTPKNPCGPGSAHSFYNREKDVVRAVQDFVFSTLP